MMDWLRFRWYESRLHRWIYHGYILSLELCFELMTKEQRQAFRDRRATYKGMDQ